jgi:hypothetical protein
MLFVTREVEILVAIQIQQIISNHTFIMSNNSEITKNSHKEEEQDNEHPRVLIPELCRQFYNLGWVTGTGGGISMKYKYENKLYNHINIIATNQSQEV